MLFALEYVCMTFVFIRMGLFYSIRKSPQFAEQLIERKRGDKGNIGVNKVYGQLIQLIASFTVETKTTASAGGTFLCNGHRQKTICLSTKDAQDWKMMVAVLLSSASLIFR